MIKSEKHLKGIIKKDFDDLKKLISNIDKYYYLKKEIKTNKDGSPKKDKDGNIRYRTMFPSTGDLKKIQSRIKGILSKIDLPENIYGGVKGKDNVANARAHKGKKYKFVTDLKDFFPTVKPKMVYDALIEHGFSQDVSSYITKLTTYKNEVPQGAPTSTHVTNLAFLPIDNRLIEFCQLHKITYTRYVDDLTFSSHFDFKSLVPEIIEIIKWEDKFSISHRKTKYAEGSIVVTGAWVRNNSLDVTDNIKQKLQLPNGLNENQIKGLENYYKRVKHN